MELQASAGPGCHQDDFWKCVPVGSLKIGRIAQNRRPYFTNNFLEDANTTDPAWALREGLVTFAGYPLLVDDASSAFWPPTPAGPSRRCYSTT